LQTFKKKERDIEQNLEISNREVLANDIEIAAQDKPTMPEFFNV